MASRPLKALNHFKVIKNGLPVKFYRETLNKPWMRLKLFIDEGPLSRTPECYKKFVYNWKAVQPSPVHYIPEPGKWKKVDGEIVPTQNYPIPLKYPHELDDGLWGGEAVVKGFVKRKKKNPPVPKYWVPAIMDTVVYSEILDKYMKVITTPRALILIDKHYGLDSYLLETSDADLRSVLSLKLRRELLFALLEKSLYPDDPVKREELYDKYKKFIIPKEELEWYGLTLAEANRKQMNLDKAAAKVGPYKNIFRREFIEHMEESDTLKQQNKEDSESSKKSFMDKIGSMNIFSRK